MSYRGPNNSRIAAQVNADPYRFGGYPATWKHYISASAGASQAAGLGQKPQYTQTTITALFGPLDQPETQGPAGMFAEAQILMTTREKMNRLDEIVWNGVQYRIDSVPTQDPLTSAFYSVINRSKT
jgi:hypothetical protein